MLTRFIKVQLVLLTILTTSVLVVLGWYYLQLPAVVGIGQYTLYVQLPRSGNLYATANVTCRGIQVGKVTAVAPTERGVRATLSIDDRYKIPIDASANVRSVSAIGEQYLDLVSTGNAGQHFTNGQTITKSTVPAEIGPALDAVNRGLEALPREKISAVLDETSQAVGGLGFALQRLVDSTQVIVHDFRDNLNPVNDIIAHSEPILDSQVTSRDPIKRWAANLNTIGAQLARQDQALRSSLQQAAPTADSVTAVFSDVRDALPQTLANLEVVIDMLKRYHNNVEQLVVALPEVASIGETATTLYPGLISLDFRLSINEPPACLTGFLPPSQWRSPADTSMAPLPAGTYCKIPKDTPANVVRGARNYPCADVPGKRAATPRECHSNEPYVPMGTDPWYGDPNQIRNCPAPGARCDQPVDPGSVIPAPSINNGMNPAPADQVPGTPPPVSDPLTRPGLGAVQCSGQQPNPCIYTPAPNPTAIYSPQSGEVTTPDGTKYTVENGSNNGEGGWKDMLSPAG
ncbi:MCE family protein [Mycobacterium sp.]|jgi:phospholipid/cholesterol/gamma-HCH transport system substrate-binding protein|uniref:MCE family protein n=1 Tax=Mycobacterium sp. TaxID=1785 RepID=UPI002C4CC56C|nr:MCE family protein [Mycobacterium sp.]HXB89457.1 MCE family protein [Mycobacterium sp.]